MKRLLLSTAILGAATVPAIAQDQTIFRETPEASELRASSFMGMRVYASETAVEGEELEGIQEGWEDIGEVNDIVMDRNGEVQAVLVDIGGFLGIGERTVAVSMDALQFVSDSATAEDAEDFFLVMNANREALENAPEYVDAEAEGMSAEQAATETDTAIEEAGESVAAAGAAAGAAVGAAVEGVEQAGQEVTTTTVEVTEGAGEAAEQTGEAVADAAGEVAQDADAAIDQAGETIAGAGQELSDDAAASGAEATEEVAQTDAVATEVVEADQAATETVVEGGEQVEASADAATTETEAATQETAEAAVEPAATTETAPAEDAQVTTTEDVTNTEPTSAETTTREPVLREGFAAAGAEDLTAERLQGAAVYDANDQRVGEVGEIILSAEGQVQQLVIDVGGFLGIGEKPVALEMSTLDILRQEGGEEVRIYVSQTEEELEQLERYEAR